MRCLLQFKVIILKPFFNMQLSDLHWLLLSAVDSLVSRTSCCVVGFDSKTASSWPLTQTVTSGKRTLITWTRSSSTAFSTPSCARSSSCWKTRTKRRPWSRSTRLCSNCRSVASANQPYIRSVLNVRSLIASNWGRTRFHSGMFEHVRPNRHPTL